MAASNLSIPVFGFDLGKVEDDSGHNVEGLKKNCFRPAVSSKTKVEQVQSHVYNLGFNDVNSQKRICSIQTLVKQQQSTREPHKCKSGIKSRNTAQYINKQKLYHRDLETKTQHSAPLCYSWGSSSSISELISRLGKQNKSRPSTTKCQNSFNSDSGMTKMTDQGAACCSLGSHDEENDKLMDTTPKPEQQPTRQPIHLCVPSACVGSDDEDEDDQNDTQRLLPHTDESVNQIREGDSSEVKNLKVAESSAPDPLVVFIPSSKRNDLPLQKQTLHPTTMCFNVSDTSKNKCPNENRKLFTQTRKTCDSTNRHELVLRDQKTSGEQFHDFYRAGDSICKNLRKIEVTPPSELNGVKGVGCMAHTRQNSTDNSANFSKHSHFSNSHDKPKPKNLQRGNVSIREDKNMTVNITPRNLGRNLMRIGARSSCKKSADLLSAWKSCFEYEDSICEPELTSNKKCCSNFDIFEDSVSNSNCSTNSSYNKLDHEAVSVVTCDYADGDNIEELAPNHLTTQTLNDLEAMTSQLSDVDINSHTFVNLYKSSTEKNCYENAQIPAPRPVQSALKENNSGPLEKVEGAGTPALIKTIKTFEFKHQVSRKITSKNIKQFISQKKVNEDLDCKMFQPTSLPLNHEIMKSSVKKKQKKALEKKSQNEPVTLKADKRINEIDRKRSVLSRSMNDLETLQEAKTVACGSILAANKDPRPKCKKLTVSKTTVNKFTSVNTHTKMVDASFQSASNHVMVKSNVQLQERISSAPSGRSQPPNGLTKTSGTLERKGPNKFLPGSNSISFTNLSKTRQKADIIQPKKDNTKPMIKPVAATYKPCAVKSASSGSRLRSSDPVFQKPKCKAETPKQQAYQDRETKVAALGIDLGVSALEKTLNSQSAKIRYNRAAGYLPSDPSYGLIPHYKHWLPEEYVKLQTIKKALAEDDRLKYVAKFCAAQRMKKLPLWMDKKIMKN